MFGSWKILVNVFPFLFLSLENGLDTFLLSSPFDRRCKCSTVDSFVTCFQLIIRDRVAHGIQAIHAEFSLEKTLPKIEQLIVIFTQQRNNMIFSLKTYINILLFKFRSLFFVIDLPVCMGNCECDVKLVEHSHFGIDF